MYGAIIGDLAGSIYEYSQFKKTTNIVVSKPLIKSTSFFSDDTILTIAITDAFLHDQNYDFYLRLYIKVIKTIIQTISHILQVLFRPI